MGDSENVCGLCETGQTTEKSFPVGFVWKGGSVKADWAGGYCSKCNDYTINPDQARSNDNVTRAVKDALFKVHKVDRKSVLVQLERPQ